MEQILSKVTTGSAFIQQRYAYAIKNGYNIYTMKLFWYNVLFVNSPIDFAVDLTFRLWVSGGVYDIC